MDLTNSFTVPADIDTAWSTLLDVEAIAPCMPGAKLTGVDGDDFTGTVKVKLGPVSLTYGGEAMFLEKDVENHVAIIEGTGKETRGSGTAKAVVTTALISESPEVTRVDVTTNLTITGKAAQFGRGVMQDVAGRLVDQFAANLEGVIAARVGSGDASTAGQAESAGESSSPAAVDSADGSAPAPAPAPAAAPAAPQMVAEALDLGSVAAGPVLKRVVPVVVGVAALAAVVWLITRKR
jgi:carbon monoxide dehydrogenase subunit G